ncbi:hypothetical protein BO94DRAFT_541429 [Aspergillus sclerotioniger CBS 115572]|uniref:Uncharacterized protein n=1 Tax=Aspergillus sclerotioniger CBS 115572 TaxID=1450535 RepID=A0A317XDL1_9EURO|nr:hypothetical protein BO94DRAFT_541429 [Aspergillus sclerotioniger CBS 115572]PWY96629.1 hypothetical protein BO94DRAFT_541429 [Aspergillus sclerotioniger CBS 115572]
MIISQLFHLLLVIWCAFTSAREPYDLSIRRDPQGPLGVRLDYAFATNWPTSINAIPGRKTRRNWLWSSHLTFNSPVSTITDAQLWQMALDGYNEIQDDMDLYSITGRNNKPNALTVLAFEDEIIIASSQRGETSFSYNFANTEVLKTLQLCQIMWKDDTGEDLQHRREEKFGEVMAAHMYYTIHNAPLVDQKARVATVMWDSVEAKLKQVDPCGNPQNKIWGCDLFAKTYGMAELNINITPESYDLSTIAGGLSIKDQIQLCTS